MTDKKKAQLVMGAKARDSVTGFEGIITSKTEWLNGCVRVCLTPPVDSEGKLPSSEWFDIEQTQAISEDTPARKLYLTRTATGGPRDNPTRNADPSM